MQSDNKLKILPDNFALLNHEIDVNNGHEDHNTALCAQSKYCSS